jgi:hypothetical protein
VCMVLGLATSGMHVSSIDLATGGMHVSTVGFGYRWDACEHWSILATSVTPICLWPLVTVGRPWCGSCLLVV